MTARPAAIAVQAFRVPPERVWDAVLDPAMIARFMFGPLLRKETILHIETDVRVGGLFSYKVNRPTPEGGTIDIDHVGRFIELDRPRRIAFTWAIAPDIDGSTVTIDIVPAVTGCTLTLTHALAPEWADYADRAQASWAKMLDVLDSLLSA